MLVKSVGPETQLSFLYGKSELEIVSATRGPGELVFTLQEKRDLSDPEKHDPQNL